MGLSEGTLIDWSSPVCNVARIHEGSCGLVPSLYLRIPSKVLPKLKELIETKYNPVCTHEITLTLTG